MRNDYLEENIYIYLVYMGTLYAFMKNKFISIAIS